MSTVLYIAGPMRGYVDHNFPAFFMAEGWLRAKGYEVLNPALDPGVQPGWGWQDYLKYDLHTVLLSDGIALLPGWQDSQGATLEFRTARSVGIEVRDLERW